MSTFPIAIARPMKNVPVNKKMIAPRERITTPAISRTSDKAMVHSMPIRLAIFGAKGEIKANASRGNVVMEPARALLIPRSSRIMGINEPTEVKGPLKLVLTKITTIRHSQLFFLFTFKKPAVLSYYMQLILHYFNDFFFQCLHIIFNIC